MCKGLIGKKLGMFGYFTAEGKYIPVTVVKSGPCVVTQIKTVANDTYNVLQLGLIEETDTADKKNADRNKSNKSKRINKPLAGHLKKSGIDTISVFREFPVDDVQKYTVGQIVSSDIFTEGECVDVTGITKGRGFSGVMKRHGFHGGRKTHGSKSHRIPGSVGCSAWPAKIIKGKKMPGHYGNKKQTIKNLLIVESRPENNLIMIKGAIPGFSSGIVSIKKR